MDDLTPEMYDLHKLDMVRIKGDMRLNSYQNDGGSKRSKGEGKYDKNTLCEISKN